MREFEQRFKHINAAPSPETPEGMEQFLSMYYFLRNMTKVRVLPRW